MSALGDQYDLAVNMPPGYSPLNSSVWWLYNWNVQPGFCLTKEEGRKIDSYAQPLYEKEINLFFRSTLEGATLPILWEWVVKILLQEVIGYKVKHFEDYIGGLIPNPGVSGTFSRTMIENPPDRQVDFNILQPISSTSPPKEFTKYVVNGKLITDQGFHATSGRQGLYVSRKLIQQYPQYQLDNWRAYATGPNTHGDATLPADMAEVVRNLFINSTWAALEANGMDQRIFWPGLIDAYTCWGNLMPTPTQLIETGCPDITDPTYAEYHSIYIPPQCWPEPKKQCGLIFASSSNVGSTLAAGYLQPLVRNLNLSFAVAFMGFNFWIQPNFTYIRGEYESGAYLRYSEESDPTIHALCEGEDGVVRDCWHRIHLPTHDATCDDRWTGNYSSGYDCDFPTYQFDKLTRAALATEAPRVDYLAQQLNFDSEESEWMLHHLNEQMANNTAIGAWPDYKAVACDWLKQPANKLKWQEWIEQPPLCDHTHYHHVAGVTCDEETGLLTISFQWDLPKHCEGGLPLPDNIELACGYLTMQMTITPILWAFTILILFFVVATAITKSIAIAYHEYNKASSNAAAAGKDKKGGPSRAFSQTMQRQQQQQQQQATTKKRLHISLLESYLNFERRLPSMVLFEQTRHSMGVGHVLLMIFPLVAVGPLDNIQCWLRFTFLCIGSLLGGMSLTAAAFQLRNVLSRVLDARLERRLQRAMLTLICVSIVLIIVVANVGSESLLEIYDYPLDDVGAEFYPIPYCKKPTPVLLLIILIINAPWIMFGMAMVGFLVYKIHFSSCCSGNAYATVLQHRLAAKKAMKITRAHVIQANTLLFMKLFWIVATGLYVIFIILPDLYHDAYDQVVSCDVIIIVSEVLTITSAFLPSAIHAWKGSRAAKRKDAKKAKAKAALDLGGGHSAESDAEQSALSRSSDSGSHSGSSGSSQDEVQSLASVLSDPISLIHFRRYAERAFDAEAIHFLLACQTYLEQLKQPALNVSQVLLGLNALVDEYVMDGSPQQINVSSTMRAHALAQLDTIKLTSVALAGSRLKPASNELRSAARGALHDLVKEVYLLVQLNSYPRFLSSTQIQRSNRLQRWAEGFDELDSEEMAAMLKKLQAQFNLAKRIEEDIAHGSTGASSYDVDELIAAAKKKEANILQLNAEHEVQPATSSPMPPARARVSGATNNGTTNNNATSHRPAPGASQTITVSNVDHAASPEPRPRTALNKSPGTGGGSSIARGPSVVGTVGGVNAAGRRPAASSSPSPHPSPSASPVRPRTPTSSVPTWQVDVNVAASPTTPGTTSSRVELVEREATNATTATGTVNAHTSTGSAGKSARAHSGRGSHHVDIVEQIDRDRVRAAPRGEAGQTKDPPHVVPTENIHMPGEVVQQDGAEQV